MNSKNITHWVIGVVGLAIVGFAIAYGVQKGKQVATPKA